MQENWSNSEAYGASETLQLCQWECKTLATTLENGLVFSIEVHHVHSLWFASSTLRYTSNTIYTFPKREVLDIHSKLLVITQIPFES